MPDFSEDQFRSRLVKHMTQRPEPQRPADYRNESPRLLAAVTDGIRAEDALGRGRLDARGAFNAMRSAPGATAQQLIGDMVATPPVGDAVDRDVFGAGMMSRALRQVRLTGRQSDAARELSARNDVALAAASDELEARAASQVTVPQILRAREIQEEWPDMDEATALELAVAEDNEPELPEAA
jgi:hypothetical protein